MARIRIFTRHFRGCSFLELRNWHRRKGGEEIKMIRAKCLSFALAAVFGLAVLLNSPAAVAKQTHHDAKQLIRDKSDGRHDIDHHGKYTASVEMRNGKIHAMHVRHSEKGEITLKKYKTNRKMVLNAQGHVVNASLESGMFQNLGTVYIGYSYIDDNGDEQIYWYPAEMIEDPYTGAIDYVPTN
jgi:hypothetical protein